MSSDFLPKNFEITNWESIKPLFEQLIKQEHFDSHEIYQKFIYSWNELMAAVSEEGGWRYINMTCNTNDENIKQRYLDFVQNIEPHLQVVQNYLNKQTYSSDFFTTLAEDIFSIFKKNIKKDIELFREKNIPLFTKIQEIQQQYAEVSGQQTIEYKDKTLTLQQAGVYLKDLDRATRKEIYLKINNRRAQDEKILNDILNQLIKLRHEVATNADFPNFRDYMHASLGRYDYSVQDCKTFHQSVKNKVMPIVEYIHSKRQEKLNLKNDYYPWDTQVDMYGLNPLKPFKTEKEFVDKTIQVFENIDSFFADCVKEMRKNNRLDLSSRIGKAPGGYQYPLYQSGIPFIFMNSVGLLRDLVTLMHESGHAFHFFLNRHYPILDFKSPPSEVAELASMSMELITMEHWNIFFDNENDLKRAKQQQLESVIEALPWIAAIDKFQHLLYENPTHSVGDRYQYWTNIYQDFSEKTILRTGLEKYNKIRWQAQLHIYEVPFYYIEYGFAQLGAIAVWKNYKQNPSSALQQYKDALLLGNTKSIPEIYKAAGIKFDFSENYIEELMQFVLSEYEKCLI